MGRTSEVLVAPLNADGSLGAWSNTTALPFVSVFHSSAAYNGFVYAIGGDDGPNWLADVVFAPINSDGSVGAWIATSSLPSPRSGQQSFAYNGFVYAVAGGAGSPISEVLVAPIKADGSLGAWSATTSLPSERFTHSSVAYNGFVYTIGGQASGTRFSDVLVAPLNADGSVGAWSTTTALPSGRSNHSSVAYNGFVYVIAGIDSNPAPYTISNTVLVAPLNADGSVGAWSATTGLPSARWVQSSVAYKDFVYTLGGEAGGSVINDVVVAPIDATVGNVNQTPALLRGSYSYLVDMQSDTTSRSIILNGQTSPGGRVRLQIRLAPDDTKSFGEEEVFDPAPLGSAIQVSGTARYVWIRATLDDTLSTDASQPTTILDVTVSPMAPPSAGVVHDGLGADIDTQTSTTTIQANWSGFSASGEDAIASYEWSIGSAFGLTDIQGWTDVGLATNATHSSLSLTVGTTYYVQVRAVSDLGLVSPVSSSDGVEVVTPPSDGGDGSDSDSSSGGCGSSIATSGPAVSGVGFVLLVLFAMAARWKPRRQ
ncbi:MAG: hypothetical protein HY716_06095 [Planctomycetes bacterium]|nr:hypothetical protein [Planctomycetota bacterium]